MKSRYQVLQVLPVVMLVSGLLPAAAQAQFTQQGPKLVGTGAVGPFAAFQGWSVALSGDASPAGSRDHIRDRFNFRRCLCKQHGKRPRDGVFSFRAGTNWNTI